ncbi:hypothetical protein PAXRUDRAFT_822971, partial [Paxillus rubicundulus Ve08.2h10]
LILINLSFPRCFRLPLLFVHLSECGLPVVNILAVVIGNPTTPYHHTGLAYLSVSLFLITD